MAAVALALVAGLLFALGAGLQHGAARASLAALPKGVEPARLGVFLPITGALTRLVCDRVWIAGWVVNICGFGVQAVALHHGAVGLVQPVLVTQLLFTIPVAALQSGRRPATRDWAAGACVCIGIGLFVAAWGTEAAAPSPHRTRVLVAVLSMLVLALVLVAAGSGTRKAVRAALASIAAGLCFASTAVLTKITFDEWVRDGSGTVLADWPVYLLALSALLGLVIGQDALAAGSLPTAVAGMAITNPLASAGIGVLAFRESVHTNPVAIVGLCFAALLLTAGVVGLAQSPTIRAGYETPLPKPVRPPDPESGATPTPGASATPLVPSEAAHPRCLPAGWPKGVPQEARKAPL